MIKIENIEVHGWEAAIRGMRNPMNSWEKMDSYWGIEEDPCPINPNDEIRFFVGPNDLDLMKRLAKGGSVHAKYRRMIMVTCDITAPLYWWKEFDTYKVGTVANSCSTMHKIHAKEFTVDDFSTEHLSCIDIGGGICSPYQMLKNTVRMLNECRGLYLRTKDREYWWQMIQLLPTSYNQRRTVQFSYENAFGMHGDRKHHKLDEWHVFCDMLERLPYAKCIVYNVDEVQNDQ